MKTLSKQRMNWIDICKGLAMLLVMLGHAPFPEELKKLIYTFHMPVFFFLSGYLFNFGKYPNFLAFLKKKAFTLLIPYFSFSIINYLYWALVYHNVGNNPYTNENLSFFGPLFGTISAKRDTPMTLHNVTLWFIACLFITELLFYCIIKYTKNNHKKIVGCLIFSSIIGYLYCTFISKSLPWSIDAALTAVVFLGAGYLVKDKLNARYMKIRYLFIFISINLISGFYNGRINMYENMYGNFALFYLSAFSGILALLIFVRLLEAPLEKLKIIAFIGKNSLIYLALHQYIVFPLIGITLGQIPLYTIQGRYSALLHGFSYTIIASVVFIPIIYFFNRYVPFILGKKRKRA